MYWRNYGCKRLQTTPVIIKSYYVFVNPDGSDEASFKRFSYSLADNDSYSTVIHYSGNHNVSQRYKVGKKQTCASVRKEKSKISLHLLFMKKVYANLFHQNIKQFFAQEILNRCQIYNQSNNNDYNYHMMHHTIFMNYVKIWRCLCTKLLHTQTLL